MAGSVDRSKSRMTALRQKLASTRTLDGDELQAAIYSLVMTLLDLLDGAVEVDNGEKCGMCGVLYKNSPVCSHDGCPNELLALSEVSLPGGAVFTTGDGMAVIRHLHQHGFKIQRQPT